MRSKTKFAAAAALTLAGCASAPPPEFSAAQLEVLAAMDAHMRTISANDLSAMSAQQTEDGMTYRIRLREDGGWETIGRPNSYWTAPERDDGGVYKERYWSPTVLVRGAMALVWAPYEFRIDGETSHCGVDAFSFAKMDGQWIVTNSMWTVEPRSCDELRPADPKEIRPAG